MKKFYAIIVAMVVFGILMGAVACASAETYPQLFVVDGFNRTENIIYLTDYNGNVWAYEGIEDYEVGDFVAAIMDDCGTPIIYDDVILTMRYVGAMEGWE